MATLEQLQNALINADKAGDEQAARMLAAEIRKMQSQPAQQDLSLARTVMAAPGQAIDYLRGAGEVFGQVASDIPAKMAAGGAGIGQLLRGEGGLAGGQAAREMQAQVTPELSERGQAVAQDLGSANDYISQIPGIDTIVEGAKTLQDITTEVTRRTGGMVADPVGLIGMSDDPQLQQFKQQAESAGAAIGEALPETAATGASMIAPLKIKASPLTKSLAQKTLKVTERGAAPALKTAKNVKGISEAVKQGFDEGVATAINQSSLVDKIKMRNMIKTYRKAKASPLDVRARPSDVAGDSLLDRFKHIKKFNRQAGSDIDRVAKKELRGSRVDISSQVDDFINDLSEMGVDFDKNLNPNFKASDVVGGKEAIKNIVDRLKSTKSRDGYNLHRMKRFIDDNVSYGKTSTAIDSKVEGALKKLRSGINEQLAKSSDNYADANARYAETIDMIDSLQSISGKRFDLLGPNADKRLGTLLRRLMGNSQTRTDLMNAVDGIDALANKYGGNFKDSIDAQALFAQIIDDAFPRIGRTDIDSAVRRGVGELPMSKGSLIDESLRKAYDKARNINEDAALKSIEELIK